MDSTHQMLPYTTSGRDPHVTQELAGSRYRTELIDRMKRVCVHMTAGEFSALINEMMRVHLNATRRASLDGPRPQRSGAIPAFDPRIVPGRA